MKALLSTCLLFLLLSPVAPLRCKTCFSHGKKCRAEDTRTQDCNKEQDACMTVAATYTILDFPLTFVYKGCVKLAECPEGFFTMTSRDGDFILESNRCCVTDECNAQDPQLPAENSLQPNGMQCPGFLSASSEHGEGRQTTVQCLSIENQCVRATFDISIFGLPYKTFAVQGCVNKEACLYHTGNSSIANGVLKYNFFQLECQEAKRLPKQSKLEL